MKRRMFGLITTHGYVVVFVVAIAIPVCLTYPAAATTLTVQTEGSSSSSI